MHYKIFIVPHFRDSSEKKRQKGGRIGSARRESLVRYDKYGNTLELKVRLSR